MDEQDPKTLLGYKLYWRRIAMHLNLREIAPDLGTTSVALSAYEKGDFTRLTRQQITGYLALLGMSDQVDAYLELTPEALEA